MNEKSKAATRTVQHQSQLVQEVTGYQVKQDCFPKRYAQARLLVSGQDAKVTAPSADQNSMASSDRGIIRVAALRFSILPG